MNTVRPLNVKVYNARTLHAESECLLDIKEQEILQDLKIYGMRNHTEIKSTERNNLITVRHDIGKAI